MILTTKGRYAVMAMLDIVQQLGDNPVTLSSISERQQIDRGYLEQLFIKLKKAGLVDSVRGPGGGYRLSRPGSKITISDIMFAVDEMMKVTRCIDKNGSGCMENKTLCITHHLWEELSDVIYSYLNSITLEDVANKKIKANRAA